MILLRKYFFLAQWFGFLPFAIHPQSFLPSLSKLRLLYSFTQIFLYLADGVLAFCFVQYINTNKTIVFFSEVTKIMYAVTTFARITLMICKRKSLMKLMRTLVLFYKQYSKQYDFNNGSKKTILIVGIMIVIIPSSLVFDIAYTEIMFETSYSLRKTRLMGMVLSQIKLMPVLSHLYIQYIFERLNNYLSKLKHSKTANRDFLELRVAYDSAFDALSGINENMSVFLDMFYVYAFVRCTDVTYATLLKIYLKETVTFANTLAEWLWVIIVCFAAHSVNEEVVYIYQYITK